MGINQKGVTPHFNRIMYSFCDFLKQKSSRFFSVSDSLQLVNLKIHLFSLEIIKTLKSH